jgi:hypothetical protein
MYFCSILKLFQKIGHFSKVIIIIISERYLSGFIISRYFRNKLSKADSKAVIVFCLNLSIPLITVLVILSR